MAGTRQSGPRRRFPSVLALGGAVLVAVLVSAGCSVRITAASAALLPSSAGAADAAPYNDYGSGTGSGRPASSPTVDAAAGMGSGWGSAHSSSPLCGDVSSCKPGSATACGLSAADAGALAPGDEAGTASLACHVVAVRADAAASSAAVCSPAGAGTAEAACRGSNDCAPGFECVVDPLRAAPDGAAQDGVCRRYCCDNTCSDSAAFCDIESTFGGSLAVPVCVGADVLLAPDAGPACVLLDDATCGPGLSCQLVNADTGQVACVTPGPAGAGQSCETAHCAAGLSCVAGYFPNRQCAQLCSPELYECPVGLSCIPITATSNAGAASIVGLCAQL